RPSRRIELTELGTEYEYPVAWSHDGSRLLFTAWDVLDDEAAVDLFVLNEDGTEVRIGTDATAFGGGSFSPDGSEVVYAAGKAVVVVDGQGGERGVLYKGRPHDISQPAPAWSPDGSTIAYLTSFLGSHPSIMTMHPDGSEPTRLVELQYALGQSRSKY